MLAKDLPSDVVSDASKTQGVFHRSGNAARMESKLGDQSVTASPAPKENNGGELSLPEVKFGTGLVEVV